MKKNKVLRSVVSTYMFLKVLPMHTYPLKFTKNGLLRSIPSSKPETKILRAMPSGNKYFQREMEDLDSASILLKL